MKKRFLLPILALFVLLAHHFFAYCGHFGFDDIEYARIAHSVTDGTYSLSLNHYAYRWGVVLPTAASYWLLGVNDFTSALPAVFCTWGMACLLLYILRAYRFEVRIFALSLFLLNYWLLYYSDKLMPDIGVAMGVFVTFWAIQERKNGFLAALGLFVAFLFKETVILSLPVIALIFVLDRKQKAKNIDFWKKTILSLFLLFLGYFGLIFAFTGHFFQRYDAIQAGSYFNPCSYDQLPISATLKRIGYEYWQMFVISGTVVVPWALTSIRSFKQLFDFNNPTTFWANTFFWLLIVGNFMSTSLTSYTPMCIDIRHYLYMMPLASLAVATNEQQDWRKLGILMLLLFFINADYWYLALFGWVVIRPKVQYWSYVCLLLPLLLGWSAFRNLRSDYPKFYSEQQKMITTLKENAKEKTKGKTYIIATKAQANMGEYLTAFDTTRFVFLRFNDLKKKNIVPAESPIFALDTWYGHWLAGIDDAGMNEYRQQLSAWGLQPKIQKDGYVIYAK